MRHLLVSNLWHVVVDAIKERYLGNKICSTSNLLYTLTLLFCLKIQNNAISILQLYLIWGFIEVNWIAYNLYFFNDKLTRQHLNPIIHKGDGFHPPNGISELLKISLNMYTQTWFSNKLFLKLMGGYPLQTPSKTF